VDSSVTEAWIALAGTITGGVGLKFVEYILGRSKYRDTLASSLRTELRVDLSALRLENQHLQDEIHDLEKSVDGWRDKYYAILIEQTKQGK
jgi:uncharacterized protein YlxW (UPF0749 family)